MVSRRGILRLASGGVVAAGAVFAGRAGWQMMQADAAHDLYLGGLSTPDGSLGVFHLGHSLVGRDMPAMLAQLAPKGHEYASQLGWGTPLRSHWYPDVPINGFEAENDHPKFLPARETLAEGGFDAVVLTEMVELKDALKYHDSAEYLANWALLARTGNPNARLYLYETWHNTDDPAGWLERIDVDFEALWLNRLALIAALQIDAPIHVIPGGQVLARYVRAIEAAGGIGNIKDRDALFARTSDGEADTIHLNDLGTYLIALTHYATLYHRSPVGLPRALLRADGDAAQAPDAEAAALMQNIVWQEVQRTSFYSGVPT